jgi:chlorophyll synthase
MSVSSDLHIRRGADPSALLTLLKPYTWFPPMWAFACGVVAAGATADWRLIVLGAILAGPVVCGMSQVANDWCDRHVDAINEPQRPIPSGRVEPWLALMIALAMTALALGLGSFLGPWGWGATVAAVAAAWAYSLPPLRLKRSGWLGPALVSLCYEGLPWFTGAAIVAGAPAFPVVVGAVLYATGAFGIMVLNDFKAIEGDRATGVRSLPAVLGPEVAAKIAVIAMALPQGILIALLPVFGRPVHALVLAGLLLGQFWAMRIFLRDPIGRAAWYNGPGVGLFVTGMMVTALAVRGVM